MKTAGVRTRRRDHGGARGRLRCHADPIGGEAGAEGARAAFLELARGLRNAVAVIPLEASRFAACKSAIKWFDYAEAGIPEYWIVNPLDETITVLALRDGTYAEHGVFRRGQRATSALLPTFAVSVSEVFDAR